MERFPLVYALGWLVCLAIGIPTAWGSNSQPIPQERFAIIVGNNQGNATDRPLRYAQSDALRVHRLLQELGAFPKRNVQLLIGRSAKEVRTAFQRLQKRLRRLHAAQPKGQTLLLFYYSGHADTKALHLGQSHLSFQSLRTLLAASPTHVRLSFLDTCQSAQILRKKGARRTQKQVKLPPTIRNLSTKGEAIITSSGVGEDSHELEQLRGSIFTHYLLSGLRGLADRNHDGRVTLNEAYAYAYQHTTSHTLFLSSGIQHPSFRNELKGHGELVMTRLRQASAQLQFGSPLSGTYYIVHQPKRLLLAELNKQKGASKTLGLSGGNYLIIKRGQRHYQMQSITLKRGEHVRLKKAQMRTLSYNASASKGIAWLTHPAKRPLSPLQIAGYTSIAVAGTSAIFAGISLGLSRKYFNDAEIKLREKGTKEPQLIQNAQLWNTGFLIALGATAIASISATTCLLLARHKTTSPPHHTTPTRSQTSLFFQTP